MCTAGPSLAYAGLPLGPRSPPSARLPVRPGTVQAVRQQHRNPAGHRAGPLHHRLQLLLHGRRSAAPLSRALLRQRPGAGRNAPATRRRHLPAVPAARRGPPAAAAPEIPCSRSVRPYPYQTSFPSCPAAAVRGRIRYAAVHRSRPAGRRAAVQRPAPFSESHVSSFACSAPPQALQVHVPGQITLGTHQDAVPKPQAFGDGQPAGRDVRCWVPRPCASTAGAGRG